MLREAWHRGPKAAGAGEGIDEHGHPYVGEKRLLAFIEGYAAARGLL
jgi:hypothetical protein